jgi:hypothetical protein
VVRSSGMNDEGRTGVGTRIEEVAMGLSRWVV